MKPCLALKKPSLALKKPSLARMLARDGLYRCKGWFFGRKARLNLRNVTITSRRERRGRRDMRLSRLLESGAITRLVKKRFLQSNFKTGCVLRFSSFSAFSARETCSSTADFRITVSSSRCGRDGARPSRMGFATTPIPTVVRVLPGWKYNAIRPLCGGIWYNTRTYERISEATQ